MENCFIFRYGEFHVVWILSFTNTIVRNMLSMNIVDFLSLFLTSQENTKYKKTGGKTGVVLQFQASWFVIPFMIRCDLHQMTVCSDANYDAFCVKLQRIMHGVAGWKD